MIRLLWLPQQTHSLSPSLSLSLSQTSSLNECTEQIDIKMWFATVSVKYIYLRRGKSMIRHWSTPSPEFPINQTKQTDRLVAYYNTVYVQQIIQEEKLIKRQVIIYRSVSLKLTCRHKYHRDKELSLKNTSYTHQNCLPISTCKQKEEIQSSRPWPFNSESRSAGVVSSRPFFDSLFPLYLSFSPLWEM